jgi:hypothetical protein
MLWSQDPTWRPWDKENHGEHHCVVTDAEEVDLDDLIVNGFILPGKQFIGAAFRELALAAYMLTGRDPSAFKCSQHFINDFERRHALSSRRFHIRRRKEHVKHGDLIGWIENIVILLPENPPERVITCDETMWRVVPNGLLTWAPVGNDGVTLLLNAAEKEAITALASMSAAHDKLPLFLIAGGKITRCEHSQLGPADDCAAAHSPSGWTSVNAFHGHLHWIQELYLDAEPIYLILDCYSVHRAHETRSFAATHGIILHFIPPGSIDEVPPLDRYVFGALNVPLALSALLC